MANFRGFLLCGFAGLLSLMEVVTHPPTMARATTDVQMGKDVALHDPQTSTLRFQSNGVELRAKSSSCQDI